jgi:hypothetical protein
MPLGSYRIKGLPRDLEEMFDGSHQETHVFEDVAAMSSPLSIGRQTEEGGEGLSGPERVSIIYPLPGDHFLMIEDGHQVIRLESISSLAINYVDWFIDGRHFARTGPPYNTWWGLERGRHTITAVGPNKTGDSVEITVE